MTLEKTQVHSHNKLKSNTKTKINRKSRVKFSLNVAVRCTNSEYETDTLVKPFLSRDRQVAEHGYDISCDDIAFL